MSKLLIRKGGHLIKVESVYNEEKKEHEVVESDVTTTAIARLFDTCEIDSGVTLRDIFKLISTNLNLFDLVIGNWCKEIVTEGLSDLNSKEEKEIEYLELYWKIYKDKNYPDDSKSFFGGYVFPNFDGVGFLNINDKYDAFGNLICKAGDRIDYSLSMTSANEIIDLPVKLHQELVIYNEDDWGDKDLQKFDTCVYTLGQIIYGIIWELSFHGGPESRENFKQKIEDITDGFIHEN